MKDSARLIIAIVDDQVDSRELLRYALRRKFPEAQLIEPVSALALVQKEDLSQVSAVVTRYKLFGNINGLQLATQLRSAGFRGRVIMLSNAEELAGVAGAAGVDEFLSFSRWAELPERLAVQLSVSELV